MKITFSLIFLCVICSCLANPAVVENRSLVRHRRQLDFFGNTRKLIEELITNLNKAALQARDAVVQFNNGLLDQARQCRERFQQELKKLQDRVTDSINRLQERFVDSGSAIGECISAHREDAAIIYQDASQYMMDCADARIKEGDDLINGLSGLCEEGQDIANQAFIEMRNCTEQSGNVFGIGTCLGSVAIRTEVKGASFLMQSGLAIGRLNLFMAILPASLEVCAGSSIVNAGIGTAKMLMDIGSCSTNSVISAFGGGSASESLNSAVENASFAINNAASSASVAISTPSGNAAASISNAAKVVADEINNLAFF